MPRYARIRQIPELIPGITESYLRRLDRAGRLPGFYSGKTKMVDVKKLMDQLDKESEANRNAETARTET